MPNKSKLLIFIVFLVFTFNGCAGQGGNKGPKSLTPAAIPSGVYWATYSVPDRSSSSGAITVDGPFYVRRVEIAEPSTSESLSDVEFPENVNCVTDTNPNDHSQYWVERIQNAEGKTTSVKLSSTAANNFCLVLQMYSVPKGIHTYDAVGLMSDDGVHSPDGSVLSDPYKDPENPIAGSKELRFKGSHRQGTNIRESVEQAGYQISSAKYQNGEYQFDALKELTGRAKIEETILKPKHWKPDDGKTKGNVGVYYYSDSFTGKITFNWNYMSIPFKVTIKDAKLKMLDDGEDQTTYSLSGTSEISIKSFTIDDTTFKLKDKQRKTFDEEGCFIVRKIPEPAVYWYYSEGWQFVCSYGTGPMLGVSFAIGKGPGDIGYVKVTDLDQIDGTYNCNWMPGLDGTATWTFKPDKG